MVALIVGNPNCYIAGGCIAERISAFNRDCVCPATAVSQTFRPELDRKRARESPGWRFVTLAGLFNWLVGGHSLDPARDRTADVSGRHAYRNLDQFMIGRPEYVGSSAGAMDHRRRCVYHSLSRGTTDC